MLWFLTQDWVTSGAFGLQSHSQETTFREKECTQMNLFHLGQLEVSCQLTSTCLGWWDVRELNWVFGYRSWVFTCVFPGSGFPVGISFLEMWRKRSAVLSAFGQPLPSVVRLLHGTAWWCPSCMLATSELPDCLHVLAERAQEWMGSFEEGFGRSATSTEVAFWLTLLSASQVYSKWNRQQGTNVPINHLKFVYASQNMKIHLGWKEENSGEFSLCYHTSDCFQSKPKAPWNGFVNRLRIGMKTGDGCLFYSLPGLCFWPPTRCPLQGLEKFQSECWADTRSPWELCCHMSNCKHLVSKHSWWGCSDVMLWCKNATVDHSVYISSLLILPREIKKPTIFQGLPLLEGFSSSMNTIFLQRHFQMTSWSQNLKRHWRRLNRNLHLVWSHHYFDTNICITAFGKGV